MYWAWLEQQLTAAGYTVQAAHPYQVKLIWQARTKTDQIDARKLAVPCRVRLSEEALQQTAQALAVGRRVASRRRPTMICAAAERQVR